jgi:hypothetical protein
MYTLIRRRLEMRNALLALVWAVTTMASAPRIAYADSPKPKETPTEVLSLDFSKITITYRIDGTQGPDIAIHGTLHIASHAVQSSGGDPIGFTLHTNLSDSFAASLDGATSYVAVGASEGIPAECQPTACPPPFWKLTFRLVSPNSAQPSLLFDQTLNTQYAADGTLLTVCVVGQDGCDIGVRIP